VAEAHLDDPGSVRWFAGYGSAEMSGPCPHAACKHLGQSVIAWGPSYERYELVACGSTNPADESASDCAMRCRAWADKNGRVVTDWLTIKR